MSKPIYILNGPNLNLLGQREPEIYGIEGEIVNHIQEASSKGIGLIINPAAYTHTSVAIHDALKSVAVPAVEVHLSQPAKRESFRNRANCVLGRENNNIEKRDPWRANQHPRERKPLQKQVVKLAL